MEECKEMIKVVSDLERLKENLKSKEMNKDEVQSVLGRVIKRG